MYTLTENDFNGKKIVNRNVAGKPAMVLFYADWCGYCKAVKPIWEQLDKLSTNALAICKINCTEPRPLSKQFNIQGYPTIFYVSPSGVWTQHTGERDFDSFCKFLCTKSKLMCTY